STTTPASARSSRWPTSTATGCSTWWSPTRRACSSWNRSAARSNRQEVPMSSEGVDRQQQKVAEFLRLLPVTLAVAGLPHSETNRHFNEGQMETRATTIRTAYKIARQLVLDVAK